MVKSLELTYLKQNGWLIGIDVGQLNDLTEALFEQLTQQPRPKILLAETDPLRFLASFLAAVTAKCPIFLCNPHWKQQEWQQVFDLVQPDLIWGTIPVSVPPSASISTPASAQIMLPTGGSSGKIRFAVHTWETLTASVQGFHRYFGSIAINSFCVLPLYHVSGLMQFMRSFLTGGQLLISDYSALKNNQFDPSINPAEFFISLVPTQLQYLLQSDPQWLSRFHTVLLGGAPAWRSLLDTARNYQIRLAPTYGMTETASQVVTLKPNDFLCGLNSSGQVLPHAQVNITNTSGSNQPGIITIQADSLCLGYYSEQAFNGQVFQTDDLGFFDADGYLHIVGRRSQKIITGGENVFPAEVEAAILATQLVSDVCVIGVPDSQWGQVVTAVYVSQLDSYSEIQVALTEKLSRFKQPKYWFRVAYLPRNTQGKVNFKEVRSMVLRLINSKEKEM